MTQKMDLGPIQTQLINMTESLAATQKYVNEQVRGCSRQSVIISANSSSPQAELGNEIPYAMRTNQLLQLKATAASDRLIGITAGSYA